MTGGVYSAAWRARLAACALVGLAGLAVAAFTASPREVAVNCFVDYSYPLLLALLGVWAGLGALWLRARGISGLRALLVGNAKPIALAAAIVLVVGLAVKAELRLFHDETNILSVSRTMLYDGEPLNVVEGEWRVDGQGYEALTTDTPKRPLLFSALASVVHHIAGYRVGNAFALNLLAFFFLLLVVQDLVRDLAGPRAGMLAMLLVAAQPIIVVQARSAAPDLLALALFVAVLLGTRRVLREPDELTLAFVWVHLLVMANLRYEAAIALGIVPLCLLAFGALRWTAIRRFLPLYLLSPVLLLPRFWQGVITYGRYENPSDMDPFSIANATAHTGRLFDALVDLRFFLPYATPINLFGALALCVLVFSWMRERPDKESWRFPVVAVAAIGSHLAIVLAYYHGWAEHPSSARFFMLLVGTLSVAAACGLGRWVPKAWIAFAIAGAAFVFYLPIARQAKFFETLALTTESHHLFDLVAELDVRRSLIVSDGPGRFVALDFGSYSHGSARAASPEILSRLQYGELEEIYVVQKVNAKTGEVLPAHRLPAVFQLQSLDRFHYTGPIGVQVSRVRNFDPDAE